MSIPIPMPISLPAIKMVGLACRTRNQFETAESSARIPQVWEDFYDKKAIHKIENIKNPNCIMGVFTKYESDQDGFYTMILGTEVKEFGHIPEGLIGLSIMDNQYLLFSGEGELPDSVLDTWENASDFFSENRDYQRGYTTDIEVYNLDELESVKLYIAV